MPTVADVFDHSMQVLLLRQSTMTLKY